MKKIILALVAAVISLFVLTACASTQHVSEDNQRQALSGYRSAVAWIYHGDSTAALEELLKAEKLDPFSADIQNALGLVYFSKEKYAQAIEHFQRAIQLDPNHADAHHNLGTVYIYQGRYDQAITEFDTALANDLYRNRAATLNSLGWAYYKKRDYLKAEENYKKCLDHDRMYLLAYVNLAKVYIALERWEEARQLLETVLRLKPDYLEAMLELGKVFQKVGQPEKAKQLFKKVLEIDPLGQYGARAQEYLSLIE